jgi:hypothetical protein
MKYKKLRSLTFLIVVFASLFWLILCTKMKAQSPNYTLKNLAPNYQVDWVGNSFPATKVLGKPKGMESQLRQHVQQDVEDLFVTADGHCYTNALRDERFAQASVYHDGEQITIMEKMQKYHKRGGYGVVANQRHAFVAVEIPRDKHHGLNQQGNPLQPSQEEVWYGVRRYRSKTGKIAGFPQGFAESAGTIVVNSVPDGHIRGLALDKKHLYVSDTVNNAIKVYELKNLSQKPVSIWSVDKPGRLAFDNEGFLWVVTYGTNKISRYQSNGVLASQAVTLPENAIAYDIAIAPQNRLLVTDMGVDRNVKIYGNITTDPVYENSLGEKGGLFSGEVGKASDFKFYQPKGVGSDLQGNIYVADAVSSAEKGGGTVISGYKPNGELLWSIHSLEFMSGLDIDPANENALYSKERLYRFNRDLPSGKTAEYQYTTLDPNQYPDDPRLHQHFIGVQMRRLQNKLMMFNIQRNGNQIAAFRFDENSNSHIAIPYAMFSLASNELVLSQEPEKQSWIWLDRNFDGQINAEEFETKANSSLLPQSPDKNKNKDTKTTDWVIEPNGNLWAVAKTSILKFPISQKENEYLTWDFASVKKYHVPSPFTEAKRFFYDPNTDVAYIAGYTEDAPDFGEWKAIGSKLARFDNWSNEPKLRWMIHTPWYPDSKDKRQKSIAMDIEGDYVFVGFESTGKETDPLEQSTVFVYRQMDGNYIGSMQQGESVGPVMLDKGQGLNVRKTDDGNYLVFLEDAAFARSVIFHWKP